MTCLVLAVLAAAAVYITNIRCANRSKQGNPDGEKHVPPPIPPSHHVGEGGGDLWSRVKHFLKAREGKKGSPNQQLIYRRWLKHDSYWAPLADYIFHPAADANDVQRSWREDVMNASVPSPWPNAARPFILFVPRTGHLCRLLTSRRPNTFYSIVGPFGARSTPRLRFDLYIAMTFLTLPRISPALALLLQDGDNIGPFDYSGHTWTPRGFAHQLRSRCRATLAEFDAFLDDPRLRKWFTFSAAVSHPKVVNLPLGLGSQRVVQKVLAMAREGSGTVLDIAEKEADVAITFSYDDVNTNHDYRETVTRHLKTRYHRMHEREREERKEITVLYANASALLPCRQSRWRNLSKDETAAACKEAKAVAYISTVAKAKTIPSPPGLGRDCFRTWEVLLMGGIPIVERRRFSHLYAGIPVIVVDSLITDVTPELIHSEYERLLRTTHWSHYQKLTVGYYQDLVRRSLGGDDGDVGGE